MNHLEDGNENILYAQQDKCYICGREKANFGDIYKKEALKQHSIKVKEKFDSFWEACETELVNTNLIKEWIKYLDTAIDKTSVDKYSDFDMWTLSDNDTFLKRIPNLPLFIHFNTEHFEGRKDTKLEEVVDYLSNVKFVLKNFNRALPIEDLNIVMTFFKEFYQCGDILYGWRNYAVECYQKNRHKNNFEVDITVITIFKKIDTKNILNHFHDYLYELKIQKLINECTEFPYIDISLNFGDYKQPLRIFLCPICERLVTEISHSEVSELRRCYGFT